MAGRGCNRRGDGTQEVGHLLRVLFIHGNVAASELSNHICNRADAHIRDTTEDPSEHWMEYCAELDYMDELGAKLSVNADNIARGMKRQQRRREKGSAYENKFLDLWEETQRSAYAKRQLAKNTGTVHSPHSSQVLSENFCDIRHSEIHKTEDVVSLRVQSGGHEMHFDVDATVYAAHVSQIKTIDDLKYVTKDTAPDLCSRMVIEGEIVMYGTQTLDSGCNAQLGQVRLNEVLTGIRDSNTCVRTAVGSDSVFPGDKHGVMNMYTLNLNPEDPSGARSTVNHAIDTVKGLNGDLFSMSNYYDELQCDIELKHHGFSGITGTHPKTGDKIRIPARYDYAKRAWLVDYVVCRNPAIAERVGLALEAAMSRQTIANMVTAESAMLTCYSFHFFLFSNTIYSFRCHHCPHMHPSI